MTALVAFVGLLAMIAWWSLRLASPERSHDRALIGISALLGACVLALVGVLSLAR
jgi:hypothetical protein